MKVIPETRRIHTKFDIYIFTAQRVFLYHRQPLTGLDYG